MAADGSEILAGDFTSKSPWLPTNRSGEAASHGLLLSTHRPVAATVWPVRRAYASAATGSNTCPLRIAGVSSSVSPVPINTSNASSLVRKPNPSSAGANEAVILCLRAANHSGEPWASARLSEAGNLAGAAGSMAASVPMAVCLPSGSRSALSSTSRASSSTSPTLYFNSSSSRRCRHRVGASLPAPDLSGSPLLCNRCDSL
eukprot:7077295-Prymnesium_polylepis.1